MKKRKHNPVVISFQNPHKYSWIGRNHGWGLPKGRPTLVCGGAGCGKTLFAMEFLVRGATLYNEPGVFISFEETEKELTANVASLGFDLDALVERKRFGLSTFTLYGVKSNKAVNTIWKVCLSGSITQLRASVPSVLCWIP